MDAPPLPADLRALVEAGQAAWPDLKLEARVLARFIRDRAGGELPPPERAADLFIACACVEGLRGAVEALERAHGDVIRRVLARSDRTHVLVDDAHKVVSERLFVGSAGTRPKIGDFAGRAPLRGWLAVVASRTVIDLRRRVDARREDEGSGTRSLAAVDDQPELAYLKARHRREFSEAARAALAALSDRERSILRLNLVEGMSVDRLAALYKVGRSTAARWLAAARHSLHEQTRRELCARLRLSDSEYASLAALVRSDLELSVNGLLAGS